MVSESIRATRAGAKSFAAVSSIFSVPAPKRRSSGEPHDGQTSGAVSTRPQRWHDNVPRRRL